MSGAYYIGSPLGTSVTTDPIWWTTTTIVTCPDCGRYKDCTPGCECNSLPTISERLDRIEKLLNELREVLQ